jgi:alpha-tubulin suppressor-like RCC1 family protein
MQVTSDMAHALLKRRPMKTTTRALRSACLGLAALTSVAATGCSAEDEPIDDGSSGSVQLTVSTPAPGTFCLVIEAAGSTRTKRSATNQGGVFPTSWTLVDVPTGSVRFNASEYEGLCVDDGPAPDAVMAWVADEQRAQINPGIPVELTFIMHPTSATGGGSVTFQTPVVEVAAGAGSTYAVLSDGRLFAWGDDTFGQLGDGTPSSNPRSFPAQVPGLTHVEHVVAGKYHVCAIADGQLYCWGLNDHGQVGNGTTTNVASPTPITLPGPGNPMSMAAGPTHTCVLLQNGGLTCWGSNANGEIGQLAASSDRKTPAPAMFDPDGGGYVQVGAGTSVTCVLRNLGFVSCTQLSSGGTPVGILQSPGASGPLATASLAIGWATRNAVRADGQVLSWTATAPAPVFSDVIDAVQAAAGSGFICAVRTGGTVMCAGSNIHGQLGDGTGVATAATVSRRAAGLTKVVQVAAGESHACAITDVGALFCWGRNRTSQLGLGDVRSRFVPTRVLICSTDGC